MKELVAEYKRDECKNVMERMSKFNAKCKAFVFVPYRGDYRSDPRGACV